MSRAFVKEEDPDSPVMLPDRPISSHPNYMTRAGYAAMQSTVAALKTERDRLAIGNDLTTRTRRAEISRDLRYAERRLDSAEIVEPACDQQVRFGHHVEFVDENGSSYTFQIVGEDEADPAAGKLFYASPLARTLIGKAPGDDAWWQKEGKQVAIEITRVARQK